MISVCAVLLRHHASEKDMISKKISIVVLVTFLLAFFASSSVVFAQNEEAPAQDQDFSETVQETGKAIGDAIPDSVKEKANEAATKIESWRIEQTARFVLQKEKTQTDIDALKDDDVSEGESEETGEDTTLKNILLHLKLIAVSILHFVFKLKVVFYIVGSLLIFAVLRWLYYRLRRPSWDVE